MMMMLIPLLQGERTKLEPLTEKNVQRTTVTIRSNAHASTTDHMRKMWDEKAVIREVVQNLIDACIRVLDFKSGIKVTTIPSPTGLPGSVIFLLNGNFAGSFVIDVSPDGVLYLTASNFGCR